MGRRGTIRKVDFSTKAATHAGMTSTMIAALQFPNISSELISLDIAGFHLALRWYALAYIAGIIAGWMLIRAAIKHAHLWQENHAPYTKDQLEDLSTWIIVGVILGGRLGSVLFYNPSYYLSHPIEILKVWQGGMAFHGGFLGVVIAAFVWGRRNKISLLPLADSLAMVAPVGLFFGRIANFINAELWGRPTDVAWGVIFPGVEAQSCATATTACARHPSQLYEAGLEGLALGIVILLLILCAKALKKPGLITGIFLTGYAISRIFVEIFRQADAQFISADNPAGNIIASLSMGQLLSVPMIMAGLYLIARARRT